MLFVIARSDSDEAIQPPRKPPLDCFAHARNDEGGPFGFTAMISQKLISIDDVLQTDSSRLDPTYDAQGYTHIKLKK
jgi:hypothetical protein